MNFYKLVVAYDGTAYHGWQWQERDITVDAVIRKAFLKAFKQDTLYIVGASRTDAGVHANGQVVRIGTLLVLEPEILKMVLNRMLPSDIVIRTVENALRGFHPQHDILHKTYTYRFFLEQPLPMVQRYGHLLPYKINVQVLAQVITLFVGTYDFAAFSKESVEKNTVRTIKSVTLEPCTQTGGYKITFIGSSFLRYMIRRMVGAAFEIARDSKRSPSEVARLLLNSSLSPKNLPTAPAKGLCLESITYQDKEKE